MTATTNNTQSLANELHGLRRQLENEAASVAKLREAYANECRRLDRRDDARLLSAKQQLDVAKGRIEGIQAEIAEKAWLLDNAQGLEAEKSRRQQVQQEFEGANQKLTETRAEVARLRAEYLALPEKIRVAEWHFHEALRSFNEARQKSVE